MTYKIPDEILLLWKERERAFIEASTTGSFDLMDKARASYDEVAHNELSKAHTAMLQEGRNYELEQIDTHNTLEH